MISGTFATLMWGCWAEESRKDERKELWAVSGDVIEGNGVVERRWSRLLPLLGRSERGIRFFFLRRRRFALVVPERDDSAGLGWRSDDDPLGLWCSGGNEERHR